MVILDKVNKFFYKGKKNQIHVINNTSLKFDNKGLIALLGASGSGKTTLLNVIGGLDKPNKGKIFINGKRINRRSVNKIDKIRNLNIGYIFQDYKLIENMTVFDNVAIVLKMIGIKDKKEIKTRVDYVLETLNIYRYRNRFASMLSGGERQRVGIARAIVKDPNIIIADEPTGNLDSKNTLEIMNIIKSISKNRLVIMVTHETDLAKFYATRIIELTDGVITADYKNKKSDKLDYRLENKIYLKDMEYHQEIKKANSNLSIYSDKEEKLDLKIVLKNNNIYIENNHDFQKIEMINNNSSIELVDEHYKQIDKSIYEKYEFNFSKIINHDLKKRYSSILNPITLYINGFKKVFNYPLTKKLLLLGFMASSMFILFSISRIYASHDVKDEDFVTVNQNYLKIEKQNIVIDEYLKYKELTGVNYIIPGESLINFIIKYKDYYQTFQSTQNLKGSLVSNELLKNEDIINGRLAANEYEIVVDKMVFDQLYLYKQPTQAGLLDSKDFLNYPVSLNDMNDFIIVGIVDLGSPSIYATETMFVDMLANSLQDDGMYNGIRYEYEIAKQNDDQDVASYLNYELKKDELKLKKGSWPVNDYEVVISNNYKDIYAIGKKLDNKINNTKLKVVGYYTPKDNIDIMFVNKNMIEYNLCENSQTIMVLTNDKSMALNELKSLNLNVYDSYEKSLKDYKEANKDNVTTIMIVSSVIIGISLIEIFLMIRSSFLSRIKEVGTYRAIGVKKKDIYKMFLGEILAISSSASLLGIIFMAYILYNLSQISYLSRLFILNFEVIVLTIIICFAFNIIVGLYPVYRVIRKLPAQILSRQDVQ